MPPSLSNPICGVYYHCYLVHGWQEMVAEQMDRLKASGLYDRAERVTVGIIGNEEDRDVLIACYKDTGKVHFVLPGNQDQSEEFKTLACLHEDACQGVFDYAWYFHTKGITHQARPGIWEHVTDWRRYLEYFLIDRWEDAFAALTDGADLYGVNWQGPSEGQPYHFSGNFFAASAAYLRRLPAPEFTGRLSNEFWIGQSARRVVCPHRSGVNHYHQPYNEENYRTDAARGNPAPTEIP